MRWITLGLAALLVLVHAELWFGKGGVPRMMELRGKLVAQKAPTRSRGTATNSSQPRSAT